MPIKILWKYIVFAGMFFVLAHTAYANLEITEIMYNPKGDDANREWIELYNNGDESVTIISGKTDSAWRFDDGSSSLHYINDQLVIPAEGYAIIASNKTTFISEYSFSGLVADTSMSLDNNGSVRILDGSNPRLIVASQNYNSLPDSNDTGNSLQKINGEWVSATPTPGLPNESSSSSSSASSSGLGLNNSSDSAIQSSTDQTTKKETEIPKITTEISAKNLVFADISFPIESVTSGYSKEVLTHGKFVWNFGDGVAKEESESKPFEYLYQYPGDYVITLSYYQNYYENKPDATDRMIIKVVPSEISISSAGDAADPFVELENKSTYEIPLSKWILKGLMHSFTIPEGTVILPNEKLKLSPKATGFNDEDMQSIALENPDGGIFATYPVIPVSKNPVKNYSANDASYTPADNANPDSSPDKSSIINLNDLGASAGNIDTKSTSSILSFMGLGGIIILGLAGIFVIRRKSAIPDYVEQNLRAEDMTIVE
ncbi:MAG TPA: lamin tail domain-containing protein [Candidatus Paceibacterota bacterium]|nr:lamin tail domain-containing protein [Candidatus Paceibacterota bacterium]